MSTDDLQPNQQDVGNDSTLRQRLLHEIACTLPPPGSELPPSDVATDEDVECGNVHPFRDLNVTSFVRQVDALFLLRWLEGIGSSQKTPATPILNEVDGSPNTKHR